jgi:hypothetical protein
MTSTYKVTVRSTVNGSCYDWVDRCEQIVILRWRATQLLRLALRQVRPGLGRRLGARALVYRGAGGRLAAN